MIPKRKREEPEDDLLTVFVELEQNTEQHKVWTWRRDALMRAGVDSRAADKLASNTDIDLHRALQLKAKGCTDANLLRILW